MTEYTVRRILLVWLILVGLFLLASCGAERPWFGPGFTGNIIVESTPPGAAIYLDDEIYLNDEDMEATTPDTLIGLDPGDYEVTVKMDDFVSTPNSVTVNLKPGQTETAVFTLTQRPKKTVILEGFSNTSCPPCPELTENLVAMTDKPEFSSDRVQFIEFAVSWPQLSDPFFVANPGENRDRYTLYNVQEAPDLYIDGIRQADPLDATAMENAVLAAMGLDPGFEISVTADFSSATVPVTVTLTATRDLVLTGHVLFVAIYEKEIEIIPAPGINGQTVFHHVFRDRVDTPPALGALVAGTPQQFDLTLTSGTAGSDSYVALAFVQNESTHAILQAGSTAAAKTTDLVGSPDEVFPVRSPERKFR
jgi:hypothetical protein